jgi:dipeptidyl aminopeptidase/acylaminoacyl peptidase
MKRSLINLIASALLLGLGWFVPHSVFDVTLETPTPLPATALSTESLAAVLPALTQSAASVRDPYGELYFTIVTPKEYYPPATPPPYIEETHRLARLPGSCVVGLKECPAAETVQTPFDMRDVLAVAADPTNMVWSPDGRYGVLVVHPKDDLTRGWTQEEFDQIERKKLEEFQLSPSTLYLFDAQDDTWRELYRADRKFFYSIRWSPDGQWIAFSIASSLLSIHPIQGDDGAYVIHPDGSGLQNLGGKGGYILGWIGNSLLLQRFIDPASGDFSHVMEMLSMDGEVKPMFESSRIANYALAPDGSALLVADGQGESTVSSAKAVNVLALDGSVIHTFGTFLNHSAGIYPFVWSRDGSMVAFANLRRVYVGPRDGQGSGFPNGLIGIPPDGPVREVYVADDTFMQPSFWNFQFSSDNEYLLMDVYDGLPHFVMVSLETGQAIPLEIKGMTSSEQASSFSWRP